MTFIPRRLANGGVCCGSETALCPACEEHFGRTVRAFNPRHLAEANDSVDRDVVPDSWAPGIKLLRAAQGNTPSASDYTDRLLAMAAFRREVYTLTTTGAAAAAEPATSDVHLHPPNPYNEKALQAWREQR